MEDETGKVPEPDRTKSRVYALYNKNRSTPAGVIEIEKEKGLVHIGINEPLSVRIKQAWKFMWHIVVHRGFTMRVHTMEEKTRQETADWYAGKGLK